MKNIDVSYEAHAYTLYVINLEEKTVKDYPMYKFSNGLIRVYYLIDGVGDKFFINNIELNRYFTYPIIIHIVDKLKNHNIDFDTLLASFEESWVIEGEPEKLKSVFNELINSKLNR